MLMRRPAVFLPLFLILFSVLAEALTRISPTAVLAGGRCLRCGASPTTRLSIPTRAR